MSKELTLKQAIQKRAGFTIVELLIVFVVIAILAAISVVAYNGIQDRTNDATIKSDLRNFSGKIMEYRAINGTYPNGGGTNGPGGIRFRFNRSAYNTNKHNIVYCVNQGAGNDNYIVAAESKSTNRFAYSSNQGMHVYAQNWGGIIDVCTNAGYSHYYFSYGYNNDSDDWWGWTE